MPSELKARHQWVVWKREIRNGRETKIPYLTGGAKAKSNDPDTWAAFEAVCRAVKPPSEKFAGVGFVLSQTDLYTGIDLDTLKPWAVPIVEKLKDVAYGEMSPGSRGIKLWTRAQWAAEAGHKVFVDEDGKPVHASNAAGSIEIYDTGRFFTVTGKGKGAIGDGQVVVDFIRQTYFAKPKPAKSPPPRESTTSNLSSDSEVIQKIR